MAIAFGSDCVVTILDLAATTVLDPIAADVLLALQLLDPIVAIVLDLVAVVVLGPTCEIVASGFGCNGYDSRSGCLLRESGSRCSYSCSFWIRLYCSFGSGCGGCGGCGSICMVATAAAVLDSVAIAVLDQVATIAT